MISDQLAKRMSGKFIVLDGLDGNGKSTQHKRLEADLAEAHVDSVSCRDPGGTEIGDRIRSILLDFDLARMDAACETMLFMASRAQLVAEVIRPAQAAGKTVLCDRFVSATCAYQGAAGYDPKRVIELARLTLGETWPAVTIVLDLEIEKGFERIGRRPAGRQSKRTKYVVEPVLFAGSQPDAMEARPIEFHRKVREIFLDLPRFYPTPVEVVNADGAPDEVYGRILEALARVVG